MNTSLVLYSVFINVLWITRVWKTAHYVITSKMTTEAQGIFLLRNTCEILVRFSILHIACTGHNRIQHCKVLWNQMKNRNEISFCLIIVALVVLEGAVISSSHGLFSERLSLKLPTSGGALSYMEAVAAPFQFVVAYLLQVTLLPTVLVLTHTYAIYNAFKVLENNVERNMATQKIYSHNELLSNTKQAFLEICKAADVVNEVFRYYIIAVIFNIFMNIFGFTFYWSLNSCNYEMTMYWLLMFSSSFGLLLLCISGSLITSGVSFVSLFVSTS